MPASFIKPRPLAALAALLLILGTSSAGAQATSAEVRVSVAAAGKPLGEVLDGISRETGLRFALDPAWRRHPVTLNLTDAPLPVALKRILDGLNSAVIYRPDGSIRLVILDNPPATATGAAPPPPPSSLRRPVDRGPAMTPPRPQAAAAAPSPTETPLNDGDE